MCFSFFFHAPAAIPHLKDLYPECGVPERLAMLTILLSHLPSQIEVPVKFVAFESFDALG